MKGAVIYYSKYGNNEKTAKAVMQGLDEAGHEVELVNVKKKKDLGKGFDFVVVGSPTRFAGNSGPVKKFISRNLGGEWKGKPFAAFGTCLLKAIETGESTAAREIHKRLVETGLRPAAEAFDNPVSEMKGPLVEDWEERARAFGRDVGARLAG